jgi:PAS domain S-box-containing protein
VVAILGKVLDRFDIRKNIEAIHTWSTSKLILVSIAIGMFFWVFEAFVHAFVFREGRLLNRLFPFELHEIWMRSLIMGIIILFSVYVFTNVKHKRTEKARKLSEKKYRNLIESSSECICHIDLDGKILYMNPKGVTLNELSSTENAIGKDAITEIKKEYREVMKDAMEKSKQGDITSLEYKSTTTQGKERWWESQISPIKDDKDNVLSLLRISRDITERKEAEEAIEKIFNMTGYMVCTADLIGNFTRVNESFEDVLGYTSEELLGQPYINLIHPDDKQKTLDVIENEMAKGIKIIGFENRYRCKDGTYKWLSWTAQPDTKTGVSYAIAYDITERKKAEESILESEEKFRSVYSQSPIAIELYDSKGNLIDVNAKCLQLFGVDAVEDVKGFKLFEDPNLSDKSKADLKKGKPVRYEAQFDFELVKKMNLYKTSKSGVKTLDVSIIPWTTRDQLPGYLVHVQDISEEKKADEALKKRERQLTESQTAAKLGNWDLNLVSGNLDWSVETYKLFDVSPEEFTPSFDAFARLVHPDDHETMQTNFDRALESDDNPYHVIVRINNVSGRQWVMEAFGAVRRGSDGKALSIYGTAQDVTERMKAEDALKSSLKEKEALLQEVHHRVKNNLQVIVSLLDLQSGKIQSEEALTSVRDVKGRIKAIALIHEQLYQSKDVALIDFNSFVKTLVERIFTSFKPVSDNIKLKIDAKKVSLGIGQAISSGLIINELVTNALEHAFPDGRNGEIQVTVIWKSGNVEIIVRDSGVGIPNDFNFKKVKTLGLHLVKILSEDQLDGKLEMIKDNGTEFRINFKSDSDKE